MRLGHNLLASISHSAWSAIVSLAVVPVLIAILGVESYGLVGLYVSAQGMLYILDMGLAPAVNREVAANTISGENPRSADLLATLAYIYWSMAAVIAIGFLVLAPAIAAHWLRTVNLSQASVASAVTLLGLVIALRWPAALYQNALMGAQRLTITSSIGIVYVTLSQGGGVLVVWLVAPTVQAFFLWQALCALMYSLLMRHFARREFGSSTVRRPQFRLLKKLWRFSLAMMGVSVTTIILMQLDKLLLSNLLGLDDFGRYSIAVLLASALYILLTPTFNNIFPRFSARIAADQHSELEQDYRQGTRLLCSALFPAALAGVFFSYEVLAVWTGNRDLAAAVSPVLSLLLLGGALNGAMHFPYALQLAAGKSQLPFLINSILCVVFVPLVVTLAGAFGMRGGAAAWLILNVIYLLMGTWLTHRVLLRGIGLRWLAYDVIAPLCLCLAAIASGKALIANFTTEPWVALGVAVILTLLTAGVCAAIFVPRALSWLLGNMIKPGPEPTHQSTTR